MDFTSDERCEDSPMYKVFKKAMGLWFAAMAVVTVYGGLQIGWWLGIVVALAWLGSVLFLDSAVTPPTTRPV